MPDPHEFDLEGDVTDQHYDSYVDDLNDRNDQAVYDGKDGYFDHRETYAYEQSLDQFESSSYEDAEYPEDERDEFGNSIYKEDY